MTALLETTERGLYCPPGGFYIDPWQPVERAVITHAHSDHARPGSLQYLTTTAGLEVLRQRVQPEATIDAVEYGAEVVHNGVRVSLHPAGHLLGSAQVRLEHRGEVCVVSGDYKVQPDATCAPFDVQRCHTFVTESTFGLPIYRWRDNDEVMADVNAWWRSNQERGRTSILFAYALGKAQRVLAGLDAEIGPILLHGAVSRFVSVYREAGVGLPPAEYATSENAAAGRGRAMVLAPPSAAATPWLRKFAPSSLAIASGWMQIRGTRRRRAVDRGFAISDHADWAGLNETIAATGAEEVLVTHGYVAPLVAWLRERGLNARPLATRFEGELDDDPGTAVDEAPPPTDDAS